VKRFRQSSATAGGGTGLGKAMGRCFMELGAELMICGRHENILAETAQEFAAAFGRKVRTHAVDIRDAAAVEALMDTAFAERPLDILVNNAAANFVARTETLSTRAVDAVLNITLHGTAYCTLAAGRRWIEYGHAGTVLSIVTGAAFHGSPYGVPSAMAKAGIIAMTRSLAVEWGPKRIRLVAISPGAFPTPGANERLVPDAAAGAPISRDRSGTLTGPAIRPVQPPFPGSSPRAETRPHVCHGGACHPRRRVSLPHRLDGARPDRPRPRRTGR